MYGFPQLKKTYLNTFRALRTHPALFTPFLIFAALDVFALVVLYLAPRMPLRIVFGPIIKAIWGEQFLHYPLNFIKLPVMTSLARMGLTIFTGSLLTAIAVILVYQVYSKNETSFKKAFKASLKEYIPLFLIVGAFIGFFFFLMRIITIGIWRYFTTGHAQLLFLGPNTWTGPVLLFLNFALAIIIQAAFVYAIPVLILEKKKLIPAVLGSFALFGKLLPQTIILVGLPMILSIPIVVLNINLVFLMNKLFPEFVFWMLFLGSLISALLIDSVVTVSTTFFYLITKEK